MSKKITIIIEDVEQDQENPNITPSFPIDHDEVLPVIREGSYYWNKQNKEDNGWVNGIDICKSCPNRPGGLNNKSGFCMCAIPSMYGPQRVTC